MSRPEPDAVAQLRVPPHSREAEQALLGGLLLDNRAWERVSDVITARDFYRFEHREIYAAATALIMANKPADVVTVHEALERAGKAHDVGGMAYLDALVGSVGGARNAREYALIIRQRSRARAVIGICDDAAARAFGGNGGEVDALIDQAITQLLALQGGLANDEPKPLPELLPVFIDELTARHESGGDGYAIATGLHKIDRLTAGGMRPGELWVIGARPSMGKTALTLTVSRNTSESHAVLMLTQEDSAQSLVMRHVAAQGRVNLSHLRAPHHPDVPNAMWAGVTEAVEALKDRRMFIDDQPGLSLADVRRKIQQVRRRDAELRVVIVDYLQLMEGEGDNRNLELGRIANGLKKAAKEFGVCVVLCSQLNREADKMSGPPQLHHLRDSGDIEGAADVIGLLYRKFRVKPEPHIKHWAQLHVAKHKNGATDTLDLWFDGETQRFEDWDGPSPLSPRFQGAEDANS